MDKPAQFQKHSLESLRFESECLQMASRSRNPDLQAHFFRMARHWNRLAMVALGEHTIENFRAAETVTI